MIYHFYPFVVDEIEIEIMVDSSEEMEIGLAEEKKEKTSRRKKGAKEMVDPVGVATSAAGLPQPALSTVGMDQTRVQVVTINSPRVGGGDCSY